MPAKQDSKNGKSLGQKMSDLRPSLSTGLVAYETLIERLLVVILAGGHVLMEGAPRGWQRRGPSNCLPVPFIGSLRGFTEGGSVR